MKTYEFVDQLACWIYSGLNRIGPKNGLLPDDQVRSDGGSEDEESQKESIQN